MKVRTLLSLLGVDPEIDSASYPEDEYEIQIVTPKFTLPVASIRVNNNTKVLEISP